MLRKPSTMNQGFNERWGQGGGQEKQEALSREGIPARSCSCGATRVDQQIGLEETPDEWCARLVAVMREARRVLRSDGVCWIEVGDTYAATSTYRAPQSMHTENGWHQEESAVPRPSPAGVKPKDLVGAPWALAKALRDPYYTGEIKSERDRVWLAATLDAEGSISAHRHDRKDGGGIRTGGHVTITNSCAEMLDNAHRIWPASRVQHDSREGSLGTRECWRWVATNVDRNALLMRELYPYLIAKRKQAMLAYNLFEMSRVAKRLRNTHEGAQMKERRDWIVANLSRLNQGLAVDVPAWIVEPPSVLEPGWYLRSDTIWSRPNPMPESVTDRPTKAHSYVFLLTKSARYYYDADAIREAAEYGFRDGGFRGGGTKYVGQQRGTSNHDGEKAGTVSGGDGTGGRNARSVWSIPTEPTPFAHFATFPQALVERCIKAGTSERGACSECGAPWRRITERDSSAPIPTKMSTQRAPMDAEAIAAYLRSHRESAGLSRADVDRALGTVTLYSWFEGRPAGIEVPTVEQWAKLKPILRLGDEFDDAVAATVEVEVTDASGGAETGDAHVRRYAKAWNSAPKFLRWEPSCRCCVAVADWIVKPCVVLDPFMGSGTTALVARRLGRHAVGCELNLEYLEISARRLEQLSLLA